VARCVFTLVKLHKNVSESVKLRNPSLFGFSPVAAVVRKPNSPTPLVQSPRPQRKRKGRVEVIATIIACRPGCLDDDSLPGGGTKALRDAIAESLGYDDGDARIRFEYGQCQVVGQQGCIVKIERL